VVPLLTIYLIGVVVTAAGAYFKGRFLPDDRSSAPQNLFWVAALAGLVWPIVLLGLVQFGLFIALQRTARRLSPPVEPETPVVAELAPERSGSLISA
jgi:hypothetical protein